MPVDFLPDTLEEGASSSVSFVPDEEESPVQKMNETEEENARQLGALAPRKQGFAEYFTSPQNPLNVMNLPGYFIRGVGEALAGIGNLPEMARRGLGMTPATEEVFGATPQTQPIPLPYAADRPTLPGLGFANEDIDPVNKVLGEALRGFTTLEMMGTAPLGGLAAKPTQALFLSQTVPGAVHGVQEAITAPDVEQRKEAAANAALNTLFSVMLGKLLGEGTKPSGITDKDVTFGPTPVTDPQMFGLPEGRPQLEQNVYQPPQPGQPFGGASFAGVTRGDVLPLRELTQAEQMEAARGQGANVYQPREERVRPAEPLCWRRQALPCLFLCQVLILHQDVDAPASDLIGVAGPSFQTTRYTRP